VSQPVIITDEDRAEARKAARARKPPSPRDYEKGYLIARGWARQYPQYATDPQKQALAHAVLNPGFANNTVASAFSFREGFKAGIATINEASVA
jgi:hypothetical protein